jgi:hypothetical protein
LRNHKDDIAAMDLFTVPTASLRLLYGFFVIEHGRRHIVHFNASSIRRLIGSFSSCEKRFPAIPHRDILSSIATRSSAPRWLNSSKRSEQGQFAPPFASRNSAGQHLQGVRSPARDSNYRAITAPVSGAARPPTLPSRAGHGPLVPGGSIMMKNR